MIAPRLWPNSHPFSIFLPSFPNNSGQAMQIRGIAPKTYLANTTSITRPASMAANRTAVEAVPDFYVNEKY